MIDEDGNVQNMTREIPANIADLPAPLKTQLVSLVKFHQSMFQMYSRIAKSGFQLDKKILELEESKVATARNLAIVQEEIQSRERAVSEMWNKVGEYNEREIKYKKEDYSLQMEMEILSKLTENEMESGDEQIVIKRLYDKKENLTLKINDMTKKLSRAFVEMEDFMNGLKKLEHERDNLEQENDHLIQKIAESNAKVEALEKEKSLEDLNFITLKAAYDEKLKEYKELLHIIEQNEQEIQHHTQLLNDETSKADKAGKSVYSATQKLQKMKQTLSKQTYENTIIQAKLESLKKELEEVEVVHIQTMDTIAKVEKDKSQLRAEKQSMEDESEQLGKQRQALTLKYKELKLKLEEKKHHIESQELWKNELELQCRVLSRSLEKNDFDKKRSIIQLFESEKKNMMVKIQNIQNRTEIKRKDLYRVQREINTYKKKDGEAKARLLRAEEDKLRAEMDALDLNQQIKEGKEKKKKNEILLETVRDERDLFNKNLKKSKDQIEITQKRFKHMYQSISQIKEEISNIEKRILKKQEVIIQIKKDEERWSEHVTQIKQKIKSTASKRDTLIIQIKELDDIIRASDKEQLETRKELDSIVNDRDILGRRLIQRNDELSSLYEKIKLQQSTINQNKIQYKNIIHQIDMMKHRMNKLQEIEIELTPQIEEIPQLKTEVSHLQKEHRRHQLKLRYLYDELSRPMNIHRWKHLQASHPELYKKIQQAKQLQKSLRKINDKMSKQEIEISSKEKLYKALEKEIQKQPGPDAVDQVATLRSVLKAKRKQFKEAEADLNKNRALVENQKQELQDLFVEIETMKQTYFTKRNQEAKKQMQNQMLDSSFTNSMEITEEEYQNYLQEEYGYTDNALNLTSNNSHQENNGYTINAYDNNLKDIDTINDAMNRILIEKQVEKHEPFLPPIHSNL